MEARRLFSAAAGTLVISHALEADSWLRVSYSWFASSGQIPPPLRPALARHCRLTSRARR